MADSPWIGPERRKYLRTPKPPCPICGSVDSRVIDSDVDHKPHVRGEYTRQRKCDNGHRWLTVERNIDSPICGSDIGPDASYPAK